MTSAHHGRTWTMTSIPDLKRKAKALARTSHIPHHQALDVVAQEQGFASWSLLSARRSTIFEPGDLVLLGARPGQGKTLHGMRVLMDAVAEGRQGYFFTLEYTASDVIRRLRQIGADADALGDRFILDMSDDISADYIIAQTQNAPARSVVVVDYLQLLDQRRSNAPLDQQVGALRQHANKAQIIIVLISQIDRSYEDSDAALPDLRHVRLPNPLDLQYFTKTCFLNAGEIQISPLRPG